MAKAIVGIGSNVGDRRRHLSKAKSFLAGISESAVAASSVYVSEPVGPSERNFLNAVVALQTRLSPKDFIRRLKEYEAEHGRPANHPRWSPRTIDLDIIAYDDLVLREESLVIPHPEYRDRLFVLLPLRELNPGWIDPETSQPIDELVGTADSLIIHKTELCW
ncbi:2-amino-4-hydroxy-6-hydroxymethyldihydropteridine diphosphokinase [Halalkalibaculum sp. DA3122]|uniref:2-amino-4-hydroxy-6- hydroxymethyldihydropteridine diphosphokinase n=1 Tax=unclassified Halalkalibaculum TaxID=2964617 RepID=UPI0037545E93